MVTHHIQKKILRQLLLGHDRFSELQPNGVDSNLYNYHLHQLITGDYVKKTADGRYQLTELGKAEGINLNLSERARLAQAHPVLLLHVRNTDGRYLLRKRAVHPMFGKIGFIHGEPVATESLESTAGKILLDRTGLTGDFRVAGSGFVRIFLRGEIESFINFTLLRAVVPLADLPKSGDETGENFWTDTAAPDFLSEDMLPSVASLAGLSEKYTDEHFFCDKTYHLD